MYTSFYFIHFPCYRSANSFAYQQHPEVVCQTQPPSPHQRGSGVYRVGNLCKYSLEEMTVANVHVDKSTNPPEEIFGPMYVYS